MKQFKFFSRIVRVRSQVAGTRHRPRRASGPRGYRKYRPCLRWDFGFTCAFCLLPEPFVRLCGGSFDIEHFLPRSVDPRRVNDYGNCFYACKWCNQARSTKTNLDPDGSRILNPRCDVWSDHFYFDGRRLRARFGDPDAAYTAAVYDFRDLRKIRAWKECLGWLRKALQTIRDGPGEADLLEMGAKELRSQGDSPLADANDRQASDLRKKVKESRGALSRCFSAPPSDADLACRCHDLTMLSLPSWLPVDDM